MELHTEAGIDNERIIQFWLFPHNMDKSPVDNEELLSQLVAEYMKEINDFSVSYLWYYDSFMLQVINASSSGNTGISRNHIGGSMIVGEETEYEWFVVFLLQHLTKCYPNLVCRVTDSEGEFLLIEASDYLPAWLESKGEQRVYIKKGKIHIIPKTIKQFTIMEAVTEVTNRPYNTLASNDINNTINSKTNQYPGKISEEQHRAHAYVPVGVAALLKEYPTLIGPCVRAFSKRDYLDNKVLRVMKHFPPEQRVLTDVKFSKGQYSEISRQSYQPDKKTGWNLPPTNHPSYASHILGVKVASGFEILVSSAGGLTPTTPTDTTEDFSDVKSNPKWIKYKQSLAEKGYFRGELEGSQLYQELEKNAQKFFLSTIASSKKGYEDELGMGTVIVNLLSKLNVDYDYFKKKEKELAPPDDENWLIKSPEMFDEMIETRYGKMPKAASEKEVMDSLSSFLTHISDMNGAEIPPELQEVPKKPVRKHSRKASGVSIPSRKVSGQMRKISSQSNASDRSNASEMSSFSNKIDMNSEAFTDVFKNILELEVPEDKYFRDSDDDSSGMSSYDEEEEISLSRKTSDGSSGVGSDMDKKSFDSDMKKYMEQMDEELKTSTVSEYIAPKIPLADLDDEFDDDIADLKSVQELITAYHEQGGEPGPASTLFNAMGLRPKEF